MVDVFINYASEDRERARPLANCLEACRWSVWWDRKLGAVAVIAVGLGLGVERGWVHWRPMPTADRAGNSAAAPQPGPENSDAPAPAVAEPAGPGELATAVWGTYHRDVVSDSKGSSQSDVALTIARVNPRRVRITSDYARLGTVEVDLTRTGDQILNASGDTVLVLDLGKKPPRLDYNTGGAAYVGQKQ